MKKLALTLAIVLGLGMASYADGGGLFGHGQSVAEETSTTTMNRDGLFPALPGQHNTNTNQPAPVGSGIAVLIGLGAAYAFAKKREE
jgi:hypothetical protein